MTARLCLSHAFINTLMKEFLNGISIKMLIKLDLHICWLISSPLLSLLGHTQANKEWSNLDVLNSRFLFKTFIYSGECHWELVTFTQSHIHTCRPLGTTTSLGGRTLSRSTGAVGVMGLAHGHLRCGNKAGPSAAFHFLHLNLSCGGFNRRPSGHKPTSKKRFCVLPEEHCSLSRS